MRTINVLLLCIPSKGNPVDLKYFAANTTGENGKILYILYLALKSMNFIVFHRDDRYQFFTDITDYDKYLISCTVYFIQGETLANYYRIQKKINQYTCDRSLVIFDRPPNLTQVINFGDLLPEPKKIIKYHMLYCDETTFDTFINYIYKVLTKNDDDLKRIRKNEQDNRFDIRRGRIRFFSMETDDNGFSDRINYKLLRRRQTFIKSKGLTSILQIDRNSIEPSSNLILTAGKGIKTFLHTARQMNHRTHDERFSINIK